MPTLDSALLVDIAKLLNLFSVVAYLLPVVMCIWRWHQLAPAYRALILAALLTSLSLNVLSEVGRQIWHTNIVFLYLITWTETLFLSAAFYQAFHTPRSRRLLLAAVLVFLVISLAEPLYWHGFNGTQTYTRISQSILLIGAALLYFEQVLQELRDIRLERDPMFLLSVGMTLYYAGALMVFVLEDSMHRQHQTSQIWIMYIIESILLMLFNLMLALALLRASEKTRSVPEQLPY